MNVTDQYNTWSGLYYIQNVRIYDFAWTVAFIHMDRKLLYKYNSQFRNFEYSAVNPLWLRVIILP